MLAVNIDRSVVGQEACEIVNSIVTGEPRVIKRRITGYMVERNESGELTARIRFQDGAWVDEKFLYWERDVAAAYARIVQQNKK